MLFVKILTLAGIDHELGVTSDRFTAKFNKDFMSWNYLQSFVLYFPGIDKFTVPDDFQYRLGLLPDEITNQEGLFLKKVKLGDFENAIPDIKFIPTNKMEENFTNQIISVKLDESFENALVDYRYEVGGLEAVYIKPFYDLLDNENKISYIEQLTKIMGDDTKILDTVLLNTSHLKSCLDEPFIIKSKLSIKSLVQKAGNNIILNIGDVIGEQVEMYDEHERDNPVELDYAHYYMRDITVEIPQGYAVRNLESLIIDIQTDKRGSTDKDVVKAAGFISKYELQGNILKINVYEFYRDLDYPIEQYEEFRNVINAAADFNKASIIFEKTN